MPKQIFISAHAALRILNRGLRHGLDEVEVRARVLQTIRGATPAKKHLSRGTTTFVRYFNDNLSVYVVCKNAHEATIVKTVILEEGRQ